MCVCYDVFDDRTAVDTEDLSVVFAPSVNVSATEAHSYFLQWTQEGETTSASGQVAHLASCGFIDGQSGYKHFFFLCLVAVIFLQDGGL